MFLGILKLTTHILFILIYEVTPRFELGMEDLQSSALPLGHVTILSSSPIIQLDGVFFVLSHLFLNYITKEEKDVIAIEFM